MKLQWCRLVSSAVATAFVAFGAYAQTELPRVTEVVEVRVTNIDVIVTDRNGQRVHGLTKEDFEIYDGGTRQEITNLTEIVAHAAGAAEPAAASGTPAAVTPDLPPRHIIIFFDNLSTAPAERRRVATALTALLRDLRPVDDAMIVTWNRRLKIVVPPTSDRTDLEAGLAKAAREVSLQGARLTMFDVFSVPTPIGGPANVGQQAAERTAEARRAIREASTDLTASVRGLNSILARLAGLHGRKALILISSAFSFHPGAEAAPPEEADMLMFLENSQAPEVLRSLTVSANAAGVPIYSMHAAGLNSGMSVTDTLPEQTLARIQTNGQSIDGLTYLAARTGGLVAANTSGFQRAVERIAEDLSSYYSIGYRTSLARRDGERRIRVRTRNGTYTARARQSAVERSFESELSDRVVASLLFRTDANQLGISARALKVDRRKRNRYAIPIDVKIPMSSLSFERDANGLTADVSVFIASADTTGTISTVERFRQRIAVTDQQMPTLATKFYTYGLDLDLKSPSAENRVAVAVIDNLSKVTGLTTVEVKP